MGPRFVLIRYYAVRSDKGSYLGTLEVTQDIAPLRSLEGENRLLDEKQGCRIELSKLHRLFLPRLLDSN
jgi:hypothetical protein